MTSGGARCGAASAAAANLAENSPKLQCWLFHSMSPNVAASQNTVVPPLPSRTSQPLGSENKSCSPARMRATRLFTGACRCDVPRKDVPTCASASTASAGTLDGPQPKRPSAGSRSGGIRMCTGGGDVTRATLRVGVTLSPFVATRAGVLLDVASFGPCAILAGVNRISRRIGAIAESATLAVDAQAKALKAAGEDVIG